MRKTHEQFIEELKTINKDITVNGIYSTAKTPLQVKCNICGNEWTTTPNSLLRGRGCPKCKARKLSSSQRLTHEEFLERFEAVGNHNVEIVGKYIGMSKPIAVRCKSCGHEWSPVAGSLLSGYGCPKCAGVLKRTHEDFVKEIADKFPNIEVVGIYKNANTPISCRCKACGYEWKPTPYVVLNGRGCPQCSHSVKKTHKQFVDEIKEIHPNIEIIGTYTKMMEPIKCKCKVCGYEWSPVANNLHNGQGCPGCKNKKTAERCRKPHEQFISELANINKDIKVESTYKNAHTKVKCVCNICGHEWEAIPQDLLRGNGCPRCSHTSTSFVEQFIFKALQLVFGADKVINRDTSTIGMELDIVLPEYKIAVEPGAWFWHKDKLENDKEKRELCNKKGLKLITIYDACKEPAPFNSDCYVFPFDLSAEKDLVSLKKITKCIIKETGNDFLFTPKTWNKIRHEAYKSSRMKTTTEFKNALNAINDNIIVLGEYLGGKEKVKCKCLMCGHIWDGTPSKLLMGQGCPKCAGTMKKTHEGFVEEMADKHPTIIVCDQYVNNMTNIKVKCSVCGNVWSARPGNLLTGYGCPECSKKAAARKRQQLNEKHFFEQMEDKGNPNVKVVGTYVNAKTKIACKCKICGHEWMATPNTLLSGHGCPECGGSRKKTTAEFKEELKEIHPSITVLGEYQNAYSPILVKCNKCNNEWEVPPVQLLHNNGCPNCYVKPPSKNRMSNEEFIEKMKVNGNPNVVVLEPYETSKKKVLCECLVCGHKWRATPYNLLQGKGCPKWQQHKDKNK